MARDRTGGSRGHCRPAGCSCAAAVPATFLCLAPALAGRASTQSPSGLLVPVDVAHVAAMSLLAGGIATLLPLRQGRHPQP